MDTDCIIVGSGFGGSVTALRLAQKGYRVTVLEQGRRIGPKAIKAAWASPRAFFWAPRMRGGGYFTQRFFKHVGIIGGVGVGGGGGAGV